MRARQQAREGGRKERGGREGRRGVGELRGEMRDREIERAGPVEGGQPALVGFHAGRGGGLHSCLDHLRERERARARARARAREFIRKNTPKAPVTYNIDR
jgi:hypothetical protein